MSTVQKSEIGTSYVKSKLTLEKNLGVKLGAIRTHQSHAFCKCQYTNIDSMVCPINDCGWGE